jgi:nitrogen regulatory protein PII
MTPNGRTKRIALSLRPSLVNAGLGPKHLKHCSKVCASVVSVEEKGCQLSLGFSTEAGPVLGFLPKAKLEIAVANDLVDQVVDAICKAAGTGKIGDGKIFVADLEQVIRIRTGETGNDAL